jgi:uncharacterized cupredoxin-like copper-binding protein
MKINVVALAAALAFASSSGFAHDMGAMGTMGHGAAPVYAFGEPGKAAKVDRTIAITMHDLSFEPSNVAVKKGETIRFVVVNASSIDHDFTVGDQKTEVEHRAEMAKMIGMGMTHGDEANAIMLKSGQRKELLWKFSKSGKFEFDCNIPGHAESGMTGTIDVAAALK